MAVEKTDIVAAFGAYYIPEGQDMARLKSALRLPSITADCAKPIIYDGELYRFSNVIFQEIVQQFQKKFTEKGDITFKPNTITLRNMKIDLALYPDDVKGSWLGFLGSLTEDERKNWPIVKYMLENEIVPQLKNDMESKAYFKGVYVAPTPGVAGNAKDTMDGIKKKLDDGLAAGTMNAVALSSEPTNANIFEMVEEFADNLDDTLAGVPTTIYMSTARVKAYLRDKRNTHGNDVNYDAGKITIDFADNVKIKGLPSMAGSPYIWATPDDNYLYIRRVNGMSNPRVEEALRQIFLMLDWWEGLGFGYDQLVYVYKPA
ncbi:hypothetical protein KBJ98_02030 [Flavobacterium sp. F-328]|uniref:Uncharacterized protein n=1 Tax=Flavobacterium erciyesense TaxID=2825842 RepID=A0ABS5D0C4_9FLAO|nr:hypothetical protein [Flavobacterium erciyesense]MBQ0907474.1 hypothetical protein [Flavobacterium erciyesense]